LDKAYDEKQANLGTNDGDLGTKKSQLTESTKQKGEDEEFLAKLTVQCKDKTEEYNARKTFAANEQVALSKAIAILDNDVASEKFGAVDATKALIQLSSSPSRRFLQQAVKQQHSKRIGQVLLLLEAGNPFTVVLQQIDNMIKMGDAEQKVDDEQKTYCEDINKKNQGNLDDKTDSLTAIEGDITKLKTTLEDPMVGLRFQIKEAEDGLKTNLENQGKETVTRREENIEYQKDVSTMSDVMSTLDKSTKVLKDYYESLDNEQVGLVQKHHQDPAPPTTWAKEKGQNAGGYAGQNEQAKKVLGLLENIKKSTGSEQVAAHDAELKEQHDYEDSMKTLTEAETGSQESIVKLNEDLATKEKELNAKIQDQTSTEREQIAIERYIAKMKPGCDFVLEKYSDRKAARIAEKAALVDATKKLKGSPSFQSATQKAK
jgi:hypothetical protein